jgi:hypothetical protein
VRARPSGRLSVARFRRRGVKREHSILPEYERLLERIAALPAVAAVIPGRISGGTRARPGVALTVDTPSGCKLLIKSAHTVLEVFVVAGDPGAARRDIERLLAELGVEG